jgi:hypothetical protein
MACKQRAVKAIESRKRRRRLWDKLVIVPPHLCVPFVLFGNRVLDAPRWDNW